MQALDHHPNESGLNAETLRQENISFQNSGGISQNNHSRGFRPAFLDTLSGKTYLARFADGRPAPFHLLDGLPATLIDDTVAPGTGRNIRKTVISGFVLEQRFYTRDQAAAHIGNGGALH